MPNNLTVEDIKLGNAYQRNQLIANLCAKTMDYRGLGSGIIRALKADADIEFRNEVSGDQFRAILWRVTQKTGAKATQKIERGEDVTQKTGAKATQKIERGEDVTQKTGVKATQKIERGEDITQKIITLIKEKPQISRKELAKLCEVSPDAIKLRIRKLRETGRIRRIGPDKGGHWEICE